MTEDLTFSSLCGLEPSQKLTGKAEDCPSQLVVSDDGDFGSHRHCFTVAEVSMSQGNRNLSILPCNTTGDALHS